MQRRRMAAPVGARPSNARAARTRQAARAGKKSHKPPPTDASRASLAPFLALQAPWALPPQHHEHHWAPALKIPQKRCTCRGGICSPSSRNSDAADAHDTRAQKHPFSGPKKAPNHRYGRRFLLWNAFEGALASPPHGARSGRAPGGPMMPSGAAALHAGSLLKQGLPPWRAHRGA